MAASLASELILSCFCFVKVGSISLSTRELGFVAPEQHAGQLWQNRDYLLLWDGQAISTTGSAAAGLALPLLLLPLTHSPVQAGLVGELHTVAILLRDVPAERWLIAGTASTR